jgi:hypothetical protein
MKHKYAEQMKQVRTPLHSQANFVHALFFSCTHAQQFFFGLLHTFACARTHRCAHGNLREELKAIKTFPPRKTFVVFYVYLCLYGYSSRGILISLFSARA